MNASFTRNKIPLFVLLLFCFSLVFYLTLRFVPEGRQEDQPVPASRISPPHVVQQLPLHNSDVYLSNDDPEDAAFPLSPESVEVHAVVHLAPHEHATVSVQPVGEAYQVVHETIRDVSGTATFKFEGLLLNSLYKLVVKANGYVPTHSPLFPAGLDRVDLQLSREPRIRFLVKTENDIPVAGADVQVSSVSKGILIMKYLSEPDGVIESTLPHIGFYQVEVTHPLYPRGISRQIEIEHNPSEYELILEENIYSITGIVLDENFSLLPEREVYLRVDKFSAPLKKVKPDSDGMFRFEGLPHGTYHVKVDAGQEYLETDLVCANGECTDQLAQTVTVHSQFPEPFIRFEVPSSYVVSGTVMGDEGNPISNAVVSAVYVTGRAGAVVPTKSEVTTDQDGAFTLFIRKRIKGQENPALTVRHPKYGVHRQELKPFPIEPVQERIHIVLKSESGFFSGRIVEATTFKPVAGGSLILSSQQGVGNTAYFELISDDKGQFETAIQAGAYRLKLLHHTLIEPFQSISIHKNETTKIELTVKPKPDEDQIIRGKVLDQRTKSPVNKAHIHSDQVSDSTKPDGTFQLAVSNKNDLETLPIVVTSSFYKPKETELDLSETDHVLHLEPYPGVLSGRMEGIEDYHDARLYLHKENPRSRDEMLFNKQEGTFHITGINPEEGPFYLSAYNPNAAGFSSWVDLQDHPYYYARVNIRFGADKQSEIKISVISDRTGMPIQTAICTVESIRHTPGGVVPDTMTKRTDDRGEVIFTVNEDFPVRLNVFHPLYESESVNLPGHLSLYGVKLKDKFNLR